MTNETKKSGRGKAWLVIIGLLLFICVGMYFVGSCNQTPNKPVLTTSELNVIKKDLSGWGEGRWYNWDASYDEKNSTLILEIAVDPVANETALKAYCDMLEKTATKRASGYTFVGRIYMAGELKKSCY